MGAWTLPTTPAIASTPFEATAKNNVIEAVATVQTTDATETTLIAVQIPTDVECIYEAFVVAESDTTAGEGASYHLTGGCHSVSGTAQLNGTGVVDAFEHANVAAGMDCAVDANAVNIRVRVTGEASHTLNWKVWITVRGYAA